MDRNKCCPTIPNIPNGLWDFIKKIPALRYMLPPVQNITELYEKFSYRDLEPNNFAYVVDENTFYVWSECEEHYEHYIWKPITSQINTDNLKDIIPRILKTNEDLDFDENNKLKFSDKEYDDKSNSGLGRVYLRKNIVDGKNILTQEMINKLNTIYIIQYDYFLSNSSLNIPPNSVLYFAGGSLSDGTIIFNNTSIKGNPIFKNVSFKGSLDNDVIDIDWFNYKGNYNDFFLSTTDLVNSKHKPYTIQLGYKTYIIDKPIVYKGNLTINGRGDKSIIYWNNKNKGIDTCISFEGNYKEIKCITPIKKGTTSIDIQEDEYITTGDLLTVSDYSKYSYSRFREYYKSGEFLLVKNKTDKRITINNPTYDEYKGDEIRINKITPTTIKLENFCMDSVRIDDIQPPLLSLRMVKDSTLNNLTLNGSNYAQIELVNCYNIKIHNIFTDCFTYVLGLNYGIAIINSQDINIHQSTLITSRHGVTAGANPFRIPIVNRNLNIVNCTLDSYNHEIPSADFHGNVEYSSYENCLIKAGISLGGQYNTIKNCTLYSNAYGRCVFFAEMNSFTNYFIGNKFISQRSGYDKSQRFGMIELQGDRIAKGGEFILNNNLFILDKQPKEDISLLCYIYFVHMNPNLDLSKLTFTMCNNKFVDNNYPENQDLNDGWKIWFRRDIPSNFNIINNEFHNTLFFIDEVSNIRANIEKNTFNYGSWGMSITGKRENKTNESIIITNNIFNKIYNAPIKLINLENIIIKNNTINNYNESDRKDTMSQGAISMVNCNKIALKYNNIVNTLDIKNKKSLVLSNCKDINLGQNIIIPENLPPYIVEVNNIYDSNIQTDKIIDSSTILGEYSYKTKANMPSWFNGRDWVCLDGYYAEVRREGLFSERPTISNDVYIGIKYYCTDTKQHLIWDGFGWKNLDLSSSDWVKII